MPASRSTQGEAPIEGEGAEELLPRVRAVVDLMRPDIQADGGDVEVVAVQAGIVQVRLHGACVGCPSSRVTLQDGLARLLRERVTGITGVEAIK
ncbi:MAG: NifU family protein [Planctomycetes bacterium]|nr:NifU family protein [Planctomycetota bacterium]